MKQLARTTVCCKIDIHKPIWSKQAVGIASYRVGTHNEINILAEGKDGEKYYPNTLYASGEKIVSCESQMLPSGIKLYIVPISELEVLERI